MDLNKLRSRIHGLSAQQRAFAVGGLFIVLASVGWALVPYSEGKSSCDPAVLSVWERRQGGVIDMKADEWEFESVPTDCAFEAGARLQVAVVATGLAIAGAASSIWMFSAGSGANGGRRDDEHDATEGAGSRQR